MNRLPLPRAAAPVLVTGVPRSGTTWLARLLAHSPGTALAGREPMNPRGRQYALGGTVDGWVRLTEPTRAQRLALVSAYRGLNPLVYSRYGARQWAAPLPRTRVVVKDPFALLSLPPIARLTGAAAVLLYRHPAALLASYRRMGWSPDTDELARLVTRVRAEGGPDLPDLPAAGTVSPAEEMGHFWRTLHDLALHDLDRAVASGAPYDVVVVAHHRLAAGGAEAGRDLVDRLGLRWHADMADELGKESSGAVRAGQLHNLDRAPAQVAEAWRAHIPADEVDAIEAVTATTLARLEELAR